MSILNDPENREWLDVSSVNPGLINKFRSTTVSFLGFDRNKNARFWGTGFVIAGNEQCAIVITAKHVLDGVRTFQKPKPIHAPSALSEFIVQSKISLEPSDLKVLWMGQKDALMMNVVNAFYSEQLDIACCVVVNREEIDKFLPFSVPLDCRTPSIGDTVHMISCIGMESIETMAPRASDGLGQTLKIKRSVNIRIGSVTGVYDNEYRQYKFPCFTTSIPAEPGMSGGFVYLPEDGDTVAACGIVSADNSTIVARSSMFHSGESVIASSWPALGLRVPDSIPASEGTQRITIYDMIKTGRMPKFRDIIDQFEIIKLEGDNYRVQRKL